MGSVPFFSFRMNRMFGGLPRSARRASMIFALWSASSRQRCDLEWFVGLREEPGKRLVDKPAHGPHLGGFIELPDREPPSCRQP